MEALIPAIWSKAAREQLKPAGAISNLEREVLRGRARLWSANNGELLIVTRLEVVNGHREFVIVAAAGRGLNRASRAIYNLAQAANASVIRFHTFNPKPLANTMQYWPIYLTEIRRGLFRTEYVYKLEVK
ncbi:hypothetical protein [Shewanella psychrotolerans]|uniref:hypothetical protein n=1 Tax=Shewanella psychrotolerans TaxID=2864206 RepID=UPI001C65B6E1|nr:hypothetical protein [Shewanella psychrotolerans]QYK03129.1 hypothetical protein K0I62_09515 [Shewanella psychrotolerans]